MIVLLICLFATLAYSILFSDHIKKNPMLHYSIAVGLTLVQFVFILLPTEVIRQVPLVSKILRAFTSGTVGTSFLFIVMITGAMMPRDKIGKRLYRIRKDLSIIGCYLVTYHILYYGIGYLLAIGQLNSWKILLLVTGLLAAMVMTPLWITSFIRVRKNMSPRKWKNIQKWSYLFYIIVLLHVLVVNINGQGVNIEKVAIYLTLFIVYGYYKIKKNKGYK